MWTFNSKTGWLDKDGILVSKSCYSTGPIPEGLWIISGPPFTCEWGEYCLRLEAKVSVINAERPRFLIHGTEKEHAGIVADRVTRERVYQSGDTHLQVISGENEQSDV